MEENSAVLECLILFYINVKHVLKTKQLVERVFIEQMIKHCRDSGFHNYRDEEIKNMWKNMVLKYLNLKNKGTVEDQESWKYFEILDSCYEQSDFHNGVYPKFSEEMAWFLIECFLKRKALIKSQKHTRIVNEIHKEFLQSGYLYVTKQDIENKWKSLNLKYDKLKDDPENYKKFPYLQALKGFHEESRKATVKMVFTRDLTEILIERFTEKKITCVIHGYDSDKVLNEIQSEFKELGFYFSKDDIREKWKALTNVYKFLITKEKHEISWIYFNAMKNHFKNDFLFPFNKKNKQHTSKLKRVRERSKSVGAEFNKKDTIKPTLVVKLSNEKLSPTPKIKLKDEAKICPTKKKSVKRRIEDCKKVKSHKKLNKANPHQYKDMDTCQREIHNNENQFNGMSNTKPLKNTSEKSVQLSKLSIDQNQDRRASTDIGTPTSKVHIINIDHSDIDRKNGNLTINLPSITKQFSDNEFLPLKKRLRIEGDRIGKHSGSSKEIEDGFRGFPSSEIAYPQERLTETNESKRLTEEEMSEIMDRINRENSKTFDANKLDNENTGNYYTAEEFNNYQNVFNNFNQQCLIVPKEEHEDNITVQNYSNSNTQPMTQPPVLLLVIKVDGSNNPIKDGMANEVNVKLDATNSQLKDCETNKEVEKRSDVPEKPECEQSCEISNSSNIKVIPSPKNITTQNEKKKSISDLEMNCIETNAIHNNSSEIALDVASTSQHKYNSDFIIAENEQVSIHSNDNDCEDIHMDNIDICSVGENVTVYTTEEDESEQFSIENTVCEPQKTDNVFQEPLPVAQKIDNPRKLRTSDKTSITVVENNTSQAVKQSDKIRLPVKGGGKLKEIYISPRELKKIAKLKPEDFRVKSGFSKKIGEVDIASTNAASKKKEFKFFSQIVKPATNMNSPEARFDKNENSITNSEIRHPTDNSLTTIAHPLKIGSKILVNSFSQSKNGKNEEFDNESIFSEAVGDDDGLKDNLLATVIDFQEQNNQEFIEIKNLMKQNNLLQRETNRLLRLILEKQ